MSVEAGAEFVKGSGCAENPTGRRSPQEISSVIDHCSFVIWHCGEEPNATSWQAARNDKEFHLSSIIAHLSLGIAETDYAGVRGTVRFA
ncbi:MAG TPA: hypothetical protein PKN61_02705 [Acidobacteriota bacterium]|jgi:hypothetical protein|nr:hypothetical protein [Acidobacteriota bacterium]HNR37925.1 hypothetical protein [Acidobacteriota bacterium]HNU00367.1 hypothetical protein [Acidobacteriota bacterium]HPB29487.1 hypothetical protein [Acidobacteriota bacterium]HQO24639.1 hypothetical protein [Acidobacteriota bacterium]